MYKGRFIEIIDDLNVEIKSGRLTCFLSLVRGLEDDIEEMIEKIEVLSD